MTRPSLKSRFGEQIRAFVGYKNSLGWRKSGTAVDKHSCKGLPQYALLCGMAAL